MENYDNKFRIIRKAISKAGFDVRYQSGSTSIFHKMNIIAYSQALKRKFWFCVDGGYGVADEYFIIIRNGDDTNSDSRYYFKTQCDMASAINKIGKAIAEHKAIN